MRSCRREIGDGAGGVLLARQLDPDLILIDLNMKPMNGFETLRALKAGGVRGRCIILTISDNERDVLKAMRAGADGYLLKDMEPEEFYLQLQKAAGGVMVLGSSVAGLLVQALTAPADTPPPDLDLTEREREIMGYLTSGRSNKEIARQLNISDGNVKVHIKHVLGKLGLKSRLEAAVWALQNPQFWEAPKG